MNDAKQDKDPNASNTAETGPKLHASSFTEGNLLKVDKGPRATRQTNYTKQNAQPLALGTGTYNPNAEPSQQQINDHVLKLHQAARNVLYLHHVVEHFLVLEWEQWQPVQRAELLRRQKKVLLGRSHFNRSPDASSVRANVTRDFNKQLAEYNATPVIITKMNTSTSSSNTKTNSSNVSSTNTKMNTSSNATPSVTSGFFVFVPQGIYAQQLPFPEFPKFPESLPLFLSTPGVSRNIVAGTLNEYEPVVLELSNITPTGTHLQYRCTANDGDHIIENMLLVECRAPVTETSNFMVNLFVINYRQKCIF